VSVYLKDKAEDRFQIKFQVPKGSGYSNIPLIDLHQYWINNLVSQGSGPILAQYKRVGSGRSVKRKWVIFLN